MIDYSHDVGITLMIQPVHTLSSLAFSSILIGYAYMLSRHLAKTKLYDLVLILQDRKYKDMQKIRSLERIFYRIFYVYALELRAKITLEV